EALSTGDKRAINRMQWEYEELVDKLEDESTNTHRVMKRYEEMLEIRAQHPSFHPDAPQEILDLGDKLFGIKRRALDGSESILAISNVTSQPVEIHRNNLQISAQTGTITDVLGGRQRLQEKTLALAPYETVWLCY
ncbi:MAG: hypothetical protein R3281_15920, partial [Balneolaceae bacterium]|nr:hypothetical protein [Balneolaceae bacterium]